MCLCAAYKLPRNLFPDKQDQPLRLCGACERQIPPHRGHVPRYAAFPPIAGLKIAPADFCRGVQKVGAVRACDRCHRYRAARLAYADCAGRLLSHCRLCGKADKKKNQKCSHNTQSFKCKTSCLFSVVFVV